MMFWCEKGGSKQRWVPVAWRPDGPSGGRTAALSDVDVLVQIEFTPQRRGFYIMAQEAPSVISCSFVVSCHVVAWTKKSQSAAARWA